MTFNLFYMNLSYRVPVLYFVVLLTAFGFTIFYVTLLDFFLNDNDDETSSKCNVIIINFSSIYFAILSR